MCWPRSRRWLMAIAGGMLAVPLLIWLLLPTEYARGVIVQELGAATGHEVSLDRLRVVGPGSVVLDNLELRTPDGDGPWFRAPSIRIDVGILELVRGHFSPRMIELEGVEVAVHRGSDGCFAEFPTAGKSHSASASAGASSGEANAAKRWWDEADFAVRITEGRFSYRDDKDDYTLDIGALDVKAVWQGGLGRIGELTGEWKGGQVELAAQAVIGEGPSYQGHIRIRGAKLDAETGRFVRYGAPIPLGKGPGASVQGELSLNLFLTGKGADQESLLDSLNGGGALILDPVTLGSSDVLQELESLGGDLFRGDIGSIQNEFRIDDRKIVSDALTIRVGRQPIVLGGWTDFAGNVDYRINAASLAGGFGTEVQKVLNGLDLGPVGGIRLQGMLSGRLEWSLDGADGRPLGEETERFRAAIERLRSRLAGRSDPAVRRMSHEDGRGKGPATTKSRPR